MPSAGLKATGVFVAVLALAMILFEDLLVFIESTGAAPSGALDSPYVLVAIPLAISLSLLAVLVGGALLQAETLR